MRYLFMGSSDYGLPALAKLIQNGYPPSLVISQPHRPSGRNLQKTPTPVSQFAMEHNLPLYTPEDINSEESIAKLADYEADIIISASYGNYLGKKVRRICPFRAVNLHPSLLPKYRGSTPIQSAILNGETETGTTIFQITAKMDAGPIFRQEKLSISEKENYSDLLERLKQQAADILWLFWQDLLTGKELSHSEQDESQATWCSIFNKQSGLINWSNQAKNIHNQIRAFALTPGAWTYFRAKTMKILASELTAKLAEGKPGQICCLDKKSGFFVNCVDYKLLITKVQAEGKRIMDATAFINGARLLSEEILGS